MHPKLFKKNWLTIATQIVPVVLLIFTNATGFEVKRLSLNVHLSNYADCISYGLSPELKTDFLTYSLLLIGGSGTYLNIKDIYAILYSFSNKPSIGF